MGMCTSSSSTAVANSEDASNESGLPFPQAGAIIKLVNEQAKAIAEHQGDAGRSDEVLSGFMNVTVSSSLFPSLSLSFYGSLYARQKPTFLGVYVRGAYDMYSRLFYESFSRIDCFVKANINYSKNQPTTANPSGVQKTEHNLPTTMGKWGARQGTLQKQPLTSSALGKQRMSQDPPATTTTLGGNKKTARFFPEFILNVSPDRSFVPLPVSKSKLWRYMRRVALCSTYDGNFFMNMNPKNAGIPDLIRNALLEGKLVLNLERCKITHGTGTGGNIVKTSGSIEFVPVLPFTLEKNDKERVQEVASGLSATYAKPSSSPLENIANSPVNDAASSVSSVSETTMGTKSRNSKDHYSGTFVRLEHELGELLALIWGIYLAF